jgi:hypothetical protein
MERLATYEGTPIGAAATDWAAAIGACERFGGILEPGGPPASSSAALTCAPPAALQALEGDPTIEADLHFALVQQGEVLLRGSARSTPDGELTVDLVMPDPDLLGTAGSFLPGSRPPGPPVFDTSTSLVHIRLRVQGRLDISGLIAEGSEADTMLQLRSRLFAGAGLDGTLELAVFPPAEGSAVPAIALAAGHTSRRVAEEGLKAFAADLGSTWNVAPVPRSIADLEATCLPQLRVMPDLAPCGAVTDRAIVLGWNPGTLLAATRDGDPWEGADDVSWAFSRFDRLLRADRQVAAAGGGLTEPIPLAYPWERIEAEATRQGDGLHATVRLTGDAP